MPRWKTWTKAFVEYCIRGGHYFTEPYPAFPIEVDLSPIEPIPHLFVEQRGLPFFFFASPNLCNPKPATAAMEGHVQLEKKCISPERVEREGRQCLDALRSLEENRSPEKRATSKTEKKTPLDVGSATPSAPGSREGIWDDDDGNGSDDWIAQSDEAEKTIESPSGARFYRHDEKVSK